MRYHFPGNVRELENILERASTLCEHDTILPGDLRLESGPATAAATAASPASLPAEGLPSGPLESVLEDIERQLITQALEASRWNRTEARMVPSWSSIRRG